MSCFEEWDTKTSYLLFAPFFVLVVRDKIHVLDLAAKLDVNAQPLCQVKWGDTMGWVKKLGRDQLPQVGFISPTEIIYDFNVMI